jgi:hypothetical protein
MIIKATVHNNGYMQSRQVGTAYTHERYGQGKKTTLHKPMSK